MEPRGLFGLAGNGLENVDVNKSPPCVPFLQATQSSASRRTARPAALQIHYSSGMSVCGAAHISFPLDRNPLRSEKLRNWGLAIWCGCMPRGFSLSSSKLSFYSHIRAPAITQLVKKMILCANITQFLIFSLWLWLKTKRLRLSTLQIVHLSFPQVGCTIKITHEGHTLENLWSEVCTTDEWNMRIVYPPMARPSTPGFI